MSLATSYAKALYQAAREVSPSTEAMDALENQMDALAQALQDRALRNAVLGPVVSVNDKHTVINAISQKVGFAKIFTNFLLMLANKGRLPIYFAICEAFNSVRLEAEGGVAGRLVSAEPLNGSDVQGLAQAFGRKLGKKVAFRVSTDPSLLAGMKVTVSGVTYDGTLKSQLLQLREEILAGIATH